ncbi:MAG: hypothetical protein P8Z33_14870 [Gammaproteobacteria bacterium]
MLVIAFVSVLCGSSFCAEMAAFGRAQESLFNPKMVWLPPFPERHQRANICGDKSHIYGGGRQHEGYNDRGRFGKARFSSARRFDDGRGEGPQEADPLTVSALHVRLSRMRCCFRDAVTGRGPNGIVVS